MHSLTRFSPPLLFVYRCSVVSLYNIIQLRLQWDTSTMPGQTLTSDPSFLWAANSILVSFGSILP